MSIFSHVLTRRSSLIGNVFTMNVKNVHFSTNAAPLLSKSFEDAIQQSLALNGIGSLSPVQVETLSVLKAHNFTGKFIVQSATGTGKTLAFLMAAFHKMYLLAQCRQKDPSMNTPILNVFSSLVPVFPLAMIIVPSAELAEQTHRFATSYGSPLGIQSALIRNMTFSRCLRLIQIMNDRKLEVSEENILEPERFPRAHMLITTLSKLSQIVEQKLLKEYIKMLPMVVMDEIDAFVDGTEKRYASKVLQLLADSYTENPHKDNLFIGSCATLPASIRTNDFLKNLILIQDASSKVPADYSPDYFTSQSTPLQIDPMNESNEKTYLKDAQLFNQLKPSILHLFFRAFDEHSPFPLPKTAQTYSAEVESGECSLPDFAPDSSSLNKPKLGIKNRSQLEDQHKHFDEKLRLFLRYIDSEIWRTCNVTGMRVLVFFNSIDAMDATIDAIINKEYVPFVRSFHSATELQTKAAILQTFCKSPAAKDSPTEMLFCTSLASRGIDFADVAVVINFDFPPTLVEYVHRAGRTGRMFASGTVVSFIEPRDIKLAFEIEKATLTGNIVNLSKKAPTRWK